MLATHFKHDATALQACSAAAEARDIQMVMLMYNGPSEHVVQPDTLDTLIQAGL